MLRPRTISSLQDPHLEPYLTLRRTEQHRRNRIFVAEGEKLVRRLLASRFEVISVLLTEAWLFQLGPLLEARPESIVAYIAPKALLEQLTGFTFYQGLLAVGRIPEPARLEPVLDNAPRPLLFAAMDQIANAENLGVIVRNCGAFRVGALLIGNTSSSPFLRRAVRSSMGAVFRIPIVEDLDLPQTLRSLRERGIRSIAAHPHVEGKTLMETDLTRNCCLVFGNEANGITSNVLAACDEAVAIPMPPGIDSLNVHTATAVFLYEANRQRVGQAIHDR